MGGGGVSTETNKAGRKRYARMQRTGEEKAEKQQNMRAKKGMDDRGVAQKKD